MYNVIGFIGANVEQLNVCQKNDYSSEPNKSEVARQPCLANDWKRIQSSGLLI